ncbi:MAG TPA: 1-acyl-sn-glycerol-3-phosphate acyltransferase [Candidatus Limnocylindrales bacterium]|nr:1-acyl-sn-glycerol-3-phosphate acyltransferase [Candidatus Limnocylindrales bacterium]
MPAQPSSVPPADLLPVQRRATVAYRVARVLLLPALHALFRLEVSGPDRIPGEGAFIVIANHLNWLDSFAVLAAFKAEPRIHFLGDPTILQQRRAQWFIVRSVGGYIPVDKHRHGDPRLYQHVDRCLQRGGVVALYPEGNYGLKEGELLPFRPGFAHFAINNAVPVVPVGLSGTKELWWRKRIGVRIGAPIHPGGLEVPALVELGRARVSELLELPQPPRGPQLFRRRLTSLF